MCLRFCGVCVSGSWFDCECASRNAWGGLKGREGGVSMAPWGVGQGWSLRIWPLPARGGGKAETIKAKGRDLPDPELLPAGTRPQCLRVGVCPLSLSRLGVHWSLEPESSSVSPEQDPRARASQGSWHGGVPRLGQAGGALVPWAPWQPGGCHQHSLPLPVEELLSMPPEPGRLHREHR